MNRIASFSSLLPALLALSAAGGCGVDAYESQMTTTIDDLKHDNKFTGLEKKFKELVDRESNKTAPPETQVGIIPKLKLPARPGTFVPYSEGSKLEGDKVIPADRLHPPFPMPEIAGFRGMSEQNIITYVGNRPWHLYVGVLRHPPGTVGGTAAYRAQVLETLKAEIANEDAEEVKQGRQPFETKTLEWVEGNFTPFKRGAAPYAWKVLDIERPQLFYVVGNEPSKVPGRCRMMVLDVPAKPPAQDHMVVLMWRFPTQLNKEVFPIENLEKLVVSSMGAFELEVLPTGPTPAAAKPN